jgi:predicted nucleic acid-binding protein
MKSDRVFADTNLFLRYLTNDVPEQADAFEQILHRAVNGEITLVVNNLVLAEIVWSLESYYRLSPTDVQDKVLAILNTPGLEVLDGDIMVQAILWHIEKGVDFIDAYNAAWMLRQGIDTIVTFDRKHFARFEAVRVLVPGSEHHN